MEKQRKQRKTKERKTEKEEKKRRNKERNHFHTVRIETYFVSVTLTGVYF